MKYCTSIQLAIRVCMLRDVCVTEIQISLCRGALG